MGGFGSQNHQKTKKDIDKRCLPKTNYFLRPFFLDFGKVLVSPDLRVGPVFASQNQFFSLFFRSSNFLSILERFGRVWGEFGEGLGRVLEGFGEGLGRFWG